ncbi:carboxy terminal-processing peptidase [Sediminibacterium ginsengisoli]|uniref:Carboxyl-terminal processing protease n=1 Tax=Sediminibacterium ginsengisoli TaxID=413434 RepID=A0A1T4QW62_9BACT|nr:carboxy terminal-processing peptidase [Sediminibacterium ginsengisoli]SKA07558.1 carboxyl-terminal processing protease [Sediminibacterium ginsengisoli]
MKSRKGLLSIAIVLFGGLFFAFRSTTSVDTDTILSQRQQLLAAVGTLLEKQHYSPKDINDEFSRKVFNKYLSDLDGDKTLFLKVDIDSLRKYENTIDDEIHGSAIRFAPSVSNTYDIRFKQAVALYKEILAKPFDFTANETVVMNSDNLAYPATEAERKDRVRKQLKYYTLERFVDLQEQREKNKGQKDFVVKSDAELEKEAREKVLKAMDKRYDRIKSTFNETQRFSAFLNAITGEMDPHTDYLPPTEKRSFDEQMSGRFYGIGAQLAQDDYGIKIASIQTGGAAWKSGQLAVGDVIIKVGQGKADPVDVSGFATEDAVKLIRGNKGTEVALTIKKTDGTIKTIYILRDEIVLDETFVRSAVIGEGKDKVGYIFVPEFYADFEKEDGNRCSEDVAKELVKLKAENVKGIVIDMRSNGGGYLYEVVQMVGLFINQGPVVQVREKDGRSTILSDRQPGTLYDGPLAVMVNELSASASEIFAAAIQDYKRGIIIGSTSTYGKGTVQKSVPFGNRTDLYSARTEYGAMKLTFQKFYRINGGSTQLKGVTPDIVLPDPYEYLKIREKDNPASLPWDEIAQAPFQAWQGDLPYETVVQKENAKIKQNPSLTLLNSNLQWLSKTSEEPASLNIDKYKQLQKQIRSTVKQNESLLKASKDLTVDAVQVDRDKYYNNPDKAKGDRYLAWLKALKSDMYIDETVKVLSEVVRSQTQTAAATN